MFLFRAKDQDRLNTSCADLILLFTEVIKHRACRILKGRRGKKEQNDAFNENRSKVKYPNSKHNKVPSEAVDACPDPIPKNWGGVHWKLIPKKYRNQIKREVKELHKFYEFAGYIKGIADCKGIKIRQGHDWDGDQEFNDQSFDDLIHTETKGV